MSSRYVRNFQEWHFIFYLLRNLAIIKSLPDSVAEVNSPLPSGRSSQCASVTTACSEKTDVCTLSPILQMKSQSKPLGSSHSLLSNQLWHGPDPVWDQRTQSGNCWWLVKFSFFTALLVLGVKLLKHFLSSKSPTWERSAAYCSDLYNNKNLIV